MAVYKVQFYLRRVLTAFIEAEDEADIDEFFANHGACNPLEDFPEIIESDETGLDEDEEGDYEITEQSNVTAGWFITPGLQLVEND